MRISNDVADVLADSSVTDNKLFLPNIKLERGLYLELNNVLTSIGGKWDRKEGAHIFKEDVSKIVEGILLTGEYTDAKREFQFFQTPMNLVHKMVDIAGIQVGETVLEPSAGLGRIASMLRRCDCIELNPENVKTLIGQGFNVTQGDFLEMDLSYDVVVANPPFSKQQDVDHITKMISIAERKVVAVASAAVLFRTNKKTVAFRELVASYGGTITPLPEGTFKESGTNVNTCLVVVSK